MRRRGRLAGGRVAEGGGSPAPFSATVAPSQPAQADVAAISGGIHSRGKKAGWFCFFVKIINCVDKSRSRKGKFETWSQLDWI